MTWQFTNMQNMQNIEPVKTLNRKTLIPQIMKNHRILIVDDDKDLLTSLEYLFEKKGYSVITANSGKNAIKLFKENETDVVITDIKMPKMDGLTLIKELRNINSNVPIIIFTGYADVDNTICSLNMGVFDFLTKPCDNDTLLNAIKRAVEKIKN